MKNREKQKTLDEQGKMTTQGGKHTRKNSDNGRVRKNIFVFSKKLTTENIELGKEKVRKQRDQDQNGEKKNVIYQTRGYAKKEM